MSIRTEGTYTKGNEKFLVLIVPYEFNVGVTINNTIVGDTNDSSNWKTFNIALPIPTTEWVIYKKDGCKIILKDKV